MGGRKKGRETSMCERYINRLPLACPQLRTWLATQACALTRNRTGDLLIHRLVFSPLSHTSQGREHTFYDFSSLKSIEACFMS